MNIIILLESLKFYKLRHERIIQIWFVLLFVINLLPLVLPVGDRNFDRLFAAFESLMGGNLDIEPAWVLLTPGNWLLIGLLLLTNLITLFFTLLYATLCVGERDDMTPAQATVRALAAVPRLIILAAVLLVPALMSAMLAFIPLVVFYTMMFFLPLNLTVSRQKLMPAVYASFEMTRHHRLQIFFLQVLLSLVISLPQNLLTSLLPAGAIAFYALSTFFIVLRALMMGRLSAILYLHLVKKVPFVIPSRSDAPKT